MEGEVEPTTVTGEVGAVDSIGGSEKIIDVMFLKRDSSSEAGGEEGAVAAEEVRGVGEPAVG